jgi:hypothetical protein
MRNEINIKNIGLRPELKKLLTPKGEITKEFCEKFLELLPDEDEIAENSDYDDGMTGDGDDYMAWGYALTGKWEEMELEGQLVWDKIEEFDL